MKYLFLALAGAADLPVSALDGRTPLEVARMPNLARFAARGQIGQVYPLRENAAFSAGAVSTALVGCDPDRYYGGQGPLEALAARVTLTPRDIVFSVAFVTTDGETLLNAGPDLTPAEMRQLTDALGERLNSAHFDFYAGSGSRAILRWRDGEHDIETTPPTRLTVGPLAAQMPRGDQSDSLRQLMLDGLEILDRHPLNERRRDEGKSPVNTFWPWGQGEVIALPGLEARSGLAGAMRSESTLMRGLARATGMTLADGGRGRNDFATDAPALLDGLDAGADLAFFHTLAPAQATRSGDPERKIHVLEEIDKHVVGPLIDGVQKRGQQFQLLVTPVHVTLTETGAHQTGPVPFLWYDSSRETSNILPFEERVLPDTKVRVDDGYRLLERLWK